MTMTDEDQERAELEEIDPAPSDEPGEPSEVEPEDDVEPLYQLPEINGITPKGLVAKLKSKKGDRLSRLLHPGERTVLIVEVLPGDLQLNRKEELIQSLEVEDFWPVPEDRAQDVLREVRAAWRHAEDAAMGRVELPFDETEAPTAFLNVDGVVMTPSELAEARGDLIEDARGLDIDPAGDTVTVEFRGGAAGLWPDDWSGSGQSLASVGGFMRLPDSRESEQVVRLRACDSGELLDEWSEADEAARLGRLEADLEAKENAEAVAVLEAGRGKGRKGAK